MKKVMFVFALAMVLSSLVFNRASEFIGASAAGPDLKHLASLYHSSDPHILPAVFTPASATETTVGTKTRAAVSDTARVNTRDVTLSDYVFLHYLRVENAPLADEHPAKHVRR